MTVGRLYRALIEFTYVGQALPDDVAGILAREIRAGSGGRLDDLSFTVSSNHPGIAAVSATVRETDPVAAASRVSAALDRSLITTGLFEEFDVTGKVLRVAPLEMAERLYQTPYQ